MFLRTLLRKSQRVRFVTLNGHRYKRVLTSDAYVASAIERNLECFADTDYFSPLVMRYENEVWVEFVEGTRPQPEAGFAGQLADFYATLYRRNPHYLAIEDTPFAQRLQRDLRFLNQVGFLDRDAYRDLQASARRITPRQVWVGFDYMDPVLKNFVVRTDSGCICVIDVESVFDGNLIGSGIAKAGVHWLQQELFETVRARLAGYGDVPDFFSYFPFIELQFLARWTKTKFLTGKRKFLDRRRFEKFRQP